VPATDTRRTIDTVWRIESGRIIAGLARIMRDVGLAEELAQDALVRARVAPRPCTGDSSATDFETR
jgi:predicted RNA polymerase sigma factor